MPDDAHALRRCLGDVIALSMMPSVWHNYSEQKVLESLVDVVSKTLKLDGVCIEPTALKGSRIWKGKSNRPPIEDSVIDDVFSGKQIPTFAGFQCKFAIIGPNASCGKLLAFSSEAHFPNEIDTVILEMACNQAAIAILRNRDQVALKELFEVAKKAQQTAESASRAKDEFLAVVTHELRGPLMPILGWTRTLRFPNTPPETFTRGLDAIERNVKHEAQLIEDLLDVSRIVTGKLKCSLRRVDIVGVCASAVESIRSYASPRGVKLNYAPAVPSCVISCDPDRMYQVLWNLLNNAIKFTPYGGSVELTVREVGAEIHISIVDTGEGIDPEFLPKLFAAFSQESEATRKGSGLGLGLSIVQYVVKAHGGDISAASAGKGQGSTFLVRLPLVSADPEMENTARRFQFSKSAEAAPMLSGIKILSVEDEGDARDILNLVLKSWGAEVCSVSSARDALLALSVLKPDLLITDISMPEMDGLELLAKVRQFASGDIKNIPAVALTSFTGPEDKARISAAGFQLHMAKPFEAAELVTAIKALVGAGK